MGNLKSKHLNCFIVGLVLLLVLKLVHGIWPLQDISLYADEALYLNMGVHLLRDGFPNAGWSPLYVIWYFILHILLHNNLNVYYANFIAMTIIPPTLLYFLLRKYNRPKGISLLFGLLLLISNINWQTWPKVSHLTLIILLLTFIFVDNESFIKSLFILSCGTLVASFTRPEFLLSYVLFSLMFLCFCLRNFLKKEVLQGQKKYLAVFVMITVLLLGVFGLPVDKNRTLIAFRQHYAWNWITWNNATNLSPWNDDAKYILQNAFGNVHSMGDVVMNNPLEFIKQVGYNIFNFGLKILTVGKHADIFGQYKYLDIGLTTLLTIFCLYRYRNSNFIENKKSIAAKYRHTIFGMILFTLPQLITTIFIFPRDHYILTPIVCMLVIISLFVTKPVANEQTLDIKRIILVGVAVLVFIPTTSIYLSSGNRPNQSVVKYLQNMGITQRVNVMEAGSFLVDNVIRGEGYCSYLNDNYRWVDATETNTTYNSFSTYLKKENINMVILTDELLKTTKFNNDIDWENFRLFHKGFKKITIPNTGVSLIFKESLLPKQNIKQ